MTQETITVAGVRGSYQRDQVLDLLDRLSHEHDVVLQAFDPDAVYDPDHLRAATEKALRAHAQGRELARELGVEIACYAAGTHQISVALETVGLPPTGQALVLVAVGPGGEDALDQVCDRADLQRDDGLVSTNEAALDRLGISATMREHVDREDWGLLVQEHVALLDVEK